jgi:hypothetical protein
MEKIAVLLGKKNEADEYRKEIESFENDIFLSFESVERKIGVKVIPASPFRLFDEGAVGSICSIYPLQLFDNNVPHMINTLHMLADRYVKSDFPRSTRLFPPLYFKKPLSVSDVSSIYLFAFPLTHLF